MHHDSAQMERDQRLWVIARVGQYHRCLASAGACLYGENALEACLRLIKVFSHPSNRRPLDMELSLAAGWYRHREHESPDATRTRPFRFRGPLILCGPRRRPRWPPLVNGAVRFPFISTCLVAGAANLAKDMRVDLITADNTGRPLSNRWFNNHFNSTHTFIDITDPDNVRYCFMVAHLHDQQPTVPAPNQPWSAWQYLDASLHGFGVPEPLSESENDPTEITQRGKGLADELSRLPLIDDSALLDAWPWINAGPNPATVSRRSVDVLSVSRGAASLWDQTMAVLVRSMLSSTEQDERLLDGLRQMPRFKSSLKHHLIAEKDAWIDSTAAVTLRLLKMAYAGDAFLDWSHFHTLEPETIAAALESPELRGARGLGLCPDWGVIHATELAEAICSRPGIEELYIMERPSREHDGAMAKLYTTLAASPNFPKRKVLLAGGLSCAFKHKRWLKDHPLPNPGLPDPVPHPPPPPHPILQLIVADDYSYNPDDPYFYPRPISLSCFFLGDAFLTPTRLVNGLIDLVPRNLARNWDMHFSWPAAATYLACAAPTLHDDSTLEVCSLPAEPFNCIGWHGDFKYSQMRSLRPGTWTVVMYVGVGPEGGDARGNRFIQCAFVRPRDDGRVIEADPANPALFRPEDIDVMDMEGFLRAAEGDFDIQSAIAIDCRLQALEQLRTEAKPDLLFSRKVLDVETVCECLNLVNNRTFEDYC